MSQNIPAWKKIGLKIKDDQQDDPIAITTHIEDVSLTKKQAQKINKQKRKLEESNNKDNKPPKRIKVPKSERSAPPERDQLVYLRQYENDKTNWKFSKQKQNWILKNIKDIPKEYESSLQAYLEGLQGGSRTRVINDLIEVIKKWNEAAAEAEAKVEREIQRQLSGNTEEETEQENKSNETGVKETSKVKKSQPVKDEIPDYDYAKRCGVLVKILHDEDVPMKGIEISDDDILINNVDLQIDQSNKSDLPEQEKETEEEEDNLIIEEVEVAGLSHSDDHLARIESNSIASNISEGMDTQPGNEKDVEESEKESEKEDKAEKKRKDKSKKKSLDKELKDESVKKTKKKDKKKGTKKDKKKEKNSD